MNPIIFWIITIIWIVSHYYFLWLNEILKNADSFAYLQMATNLANFSLNWFWTGWFGFIYSLPIALFSFITSDLFFLAQIINLLLFALGWYFLYKIWEKYLKWYYLFIPLILYYTSSPLLGFNIQVLSENIYIPIFLALVYLLQNYQRNTFEKTLWISFLMALMYLTRAEAFIYFWSLFLIFLYFAIYTDIWFKKSSLYFISIVIWFFLLISPYLYYLHSFTWEWALTNKWSSNLRQANMRWIDKMDDIGFEKAVWELTPDKHHLMAGFAGGLKYDKSYGTWSTKDFLLENKLETISRILENQKKLYSENIPKMLAWESIKKVIEYYKTKNNLLLWIIWTLVFIFLFSFIWWLFKFIDRWLKKWENFEFVVIFLSFFFVASSFFSIFFILDRYFVIMLPLAFIFSAYFWQESLALWWSNYIIIPLIVYFSLTWFYSENKWNDSNYLVKKEAWDWIAENYKDDDTLKIMERWPIVTYYAKSPERWITPYTDSLPDIVKYAQFNKIDLLVVDSLDFATYRPELKTLLEGKDNYFGIEKLKEFQNWNKKVIIYKFK